MEIVKQLGSLVEQATSDAHQETPLQLYSKILTIVQSRADMYLYSHSGPSMSSMPSPKDSVSRTKKYSTTALTFSNISPIMSNFHSTLKYQPKNFYSKYPRSS